MILAHLDGSGALPWLEYPLTAVLAAIAWSAYQRATAPHGGVVRSRRSRHRLWCWQAAILSIMAMQLPPMDQWVEQSFAAHMVQHVVLVSVSAPLIVMARPGAAVGSAVHSAGWSHPAIEWVRSAARALSMPVACWAAAVGYVWLVHFSVIYDLAVGNDLVHLLEHGGFLFAGVLAWLPVLGPRHLALPDPLKVLYVMVLMPALTFCGVTLFSTNHVLYSSYAARPDALGDQRLGGMIMWVLPGAAMLPLGLVLVARWWRREEQAALLADRAELVSWAPPPGAGAVRESPRSSSERIPGDPTTHGEPGIPGPPSG